MIEVQQLQHKITSIQAVSSTTYTSSNGSDIKVSRRMFNNSTAPVLWVVLCIVYSGYRNNSKNITGSATVYSQ